MLKGLILKDLMNLKSYKTTMIFFLVLFSAVNFMNEEMSSFMAIFVTMVFGMVAISSFSYDNISQSDKYILSCPITRKDMVKARYLYVLLFTIIGAVLALILSLVFQVIKMGNLTQISDTISTTLGAFLGMIILQIFQIPIMYKFGAEKGRIIQMLMIVLVMLLISGITVLCMKTSSFSLEQLGNFLKKYGIAIIAVIIAGLYFLSYRISVGIFSKKEI